MACADILQVGSRNMQNFTLLEEVGKCRMPVLLKRGMSATLAEYLLAAEHVMKGGNGQVILCERGIRTFEPSTRNTLDLNAVPMLKRHTHLPVIVDPSHGTGQAWMVPAMALRGRRGGSGRAAHRGARLSRARAERRPAGADVRGVRSTRWPSISARSPRPSAGASHEAARRAGGGRPVALAVLAQERGPQSAVRVGRPAGAEQRASIGPCSAR